MSLNFEEVRRLIPQKYPFLFIDRVVELEEGKRIVCLKNVSGNEPFFVGHFPDYAIMPGALTLEALAQASIILFKKSFPPKGDSNSVFLLASVKASFLKPVFPGDQLLLEVTVDKVVSTGAIVQGLARVGGETVAKASLTFGLSERSAIEALG